MPPTSVMSSSASSDARPKSPSSSAAATSPPPSTAAAVGKTAGASGLSTSDDGAQGAEDGDARDSQSSNISLSQSQADGKSAPSSQGSESGGPTTNGRPRLTVERRSLSVNTGALGRSPAPPISPSASQNQSLERQQLAPGASASRLGQSLATMHEDPHHTAFNESLGMAAAPLSADAGLAFSTDPRLPPSRWDAYQDGQTRPSRHRSTSSAAALALHGSGSGLDASDAFSSLSTLRMPPPPAARSIWERDVPTSGDGFGTIGRYRTGSSPQSFQPAVQRGFSFSAAQQQRPGNGAVLPAIGTPASQRPVNVGFLRDRGVTFSGGDFPSQDRFAFGGGGHGAMMPDHFASSSLTQSSALGSDSGDAIPVGTESRRHSIAGDLTPDAGVIGGQRRAVGFEVSRTVGFGAPSRRVPDEPLDSRSRSSSFAPFGSSSLALTDDDLAGDSDFDPLQKELDRAKQEQDREHQQQQKRNDAGGGFRVPSDTAAAAGAHAASMPSVSGNRGLGDFASSPAAPGLDFARNQMQGRVPHHSNGGLDSLSASWDILTPSAQVGGRSSDERRDNSIALMTKQLRETSIGGGRSSPSSASLPAGTDDDHLAGTATVKASPGTSPQQTSHLRGASGRFPLSATAKAFQGGQLGAPNAGSDARSAMPSYEDTYLRQRSSSIASDHSGAYGASGPVAGGYPAGSMVGGSAAFGPAGPGVGSGYPTPASVASAGFINPYLIPAHSLPAPPQLTDFAFSGLASLGPLPPPSGGGGPAFGGAQQAELQELGKGVPLSSLSTDTALYIVEFKQGRTDLFFRHRASGDSSARWCGEDDPIVKGDLVIVEADRGKDLGSVVNDNITVEQVQSFLAHQSELAAIAGGGARHTSSDDASSGAGGLSGSPSSPTAARPTRSINPKRLFGKATPADASLLFTKAQDEERALQLCITKVTQRGLPMTIVAAEMQWDRRKLTFYYTASMRVDFRDLVKELFRLYKTRIWMCHLGHPSGSGMV